MSYGTGARLGAAAALVLLLAVLAGCATGAAAPPEDLSGRWETGSGLDAASLVLHRTAEGSYTVEWETSGCLGGHSGSTTAVLVAGRLRLASPVVLYSDDEVSSYRVLRSWRRTVLVPDSPALSSAYADIQTLHPATR